MVRLLVSSRRAAISMLVASYTSSYFTVKFAVLSYMLSPQNHHGEAFESLEGNRLPHWGERIGYSSGSLACRRSQHTGWYKVQCRCLSLVATSAGDTWSEPKIETCSGEASEFCGADGF